MELNKKPSRKDLLKVIEELQRLVGTAHGLQSNDRNIFGPEKALELLMEAHELCILARSFDKPT